MLGRVLANGMGVLREVLVEALRVAPREALGAMLEALIEKAKEATRAVWKRGSLDQINLSLT
jgi:hypothetical protein